MDVRYLILLLFFAVSCMPSPSSVSKGNIAGSGSTTTGSNGGSASSQTSLKWNYLNANTNNITINVSNYNNAYLVGNPVESYLLGIPNFINEDFCFVGTYLIGGIDYELRSRAVPISYYDFVAKRTVRIIRVDFPDVTNSTTICNKTLRISDGSDNFVVDGNVPPAARVKFDPNTICPNCTSTLIANNLRLFKLNGDLNTLDQVPVSKIDTGILAMQVDPNFGVGGGAGTCSNSDCRARGFDCCLDNQCANDGAIRPAAYSTYASQLASAEAERLQNPMAYLNYPQLYYICGSTVPTDPTGGSTSGTGGSYEPGLEQLKKDYACIQNLKNQATTTPFHNEVMTKTYTPAVNCLTDAGDFADPQFYQTVMKRLYQTCGCDRTELSDMITNCPNYDYTIIARDSNNQPLAFNCYTPPTNPTVPTRQSVSFTGRTAPHRFFDINGLESDPSKGVEQEGDKFEYIDEGKILPVQQPFSMNAILGQMAVTLDQAMPAKTVNVELDQVYLVSTTSGFYTPCPMCSKDSWLNTFTAFPTTAYGSGLQATGHTTERDIFSTNTTAGNYEDTIFGRACWIPPTMIPFTHTAKSPVATQRKDRLAAQAALFINGYQRDWYGFNKGAVIGSFDGVKWFAIGKGRIVRSTSKKLFIAINAPFADVASPTLQVVNVSAYDGISQASALDYDPQYHQYHPLQNEGGNCQKYHQCNVDSDCITKLGWEYACADLQDLTTNWPEFDADAKEKANSSVNIPIQEILQQKSFGSLSSKRCVYRGAGSLCHRSSQSLVTTDPNKAKLLTCAPNFYCASISTGGVHNTRVARYAAPLEEIPATRNHFFGKDANVLGRPMDYLGTGSILASARTAIVDNMDSFEATMNSNTGICQPGKALPTTATESTLWNPYTQHQSADASKRTDFISQIGSCNSGLFSVNRHTSCPVIDTDGNYRLFGTALNQFDYRQKATSQNSCGLESLRSDANLMSTPDTLQSFSPFRNIEAKPLNAQIILDPTLARDACFRRAGSVCHTDLDCSPNKFHANQVDNFPTNFFGNVAERNYWSESLVCGQHDPKPLPSDILAFKDYDMTKNRCCREVGKDLTTFTNYVPTNTQGTTYLDYDFSSATTTPALATLIAPGVNPNSPVRYSRFATVEDITDISKRVPLTAYQTRITSGSSSLGLVNSTNVMSEKQWPTLNEANSETCCGGGWIRKFSDGTTDWTRRDRVVLDVNNFRCLNSRNVLLTNPLAAAAQYPGTPTVAQLVSQDFVNYCVDPSGTVGSCAQYSFSTGAASLPQNDPYGFIRINTIRPNFRTPNSQLDYYFTPKSGDSDAAVTIDYSNTSLLARKNIQIKFPSYIPKDFDNRYADNVTNPNGSGLLNTSPVTTAMQVRMVLEDGSSLQCVKDNTWNPTAATQPYGANACGNPGNGCCYFSFNASTRVLRVGANDRARDTIFDKKRVGIEIMNITVGGVARTRPGSALFYLKNLGQLELSGIPQISHPAVMCNDDSSRVVDGIFNPSIKTAAQFQANTFSFLSSASGLSQYYTNMNGLQLDPVFSANDFKCCSPLGKTVKSASLCCSGFGVREDPSDPSSQTTCMLPPGTDLMVYFNRFVSNEGQGADQPGGGLVSADFDERTGEPIINSTVTDKIRELGAAYCSSGETRQGGAFGQYEPEPNGPNTDLSQRVYGIVDSPNDAGQASNAGSTQPDGYNSFMDGFRWNHHLYCTDGM